ncbi:MAG: hypothetical protein AAGE85_17455, partial [Pseudomonadota bacterium]
MQLKLGEQNKQPPYSNLIATNSGHYASKGQVTDLRYNARCPPAAQCQSRSRGDDLREPAKLEFAPRVNGNKLKIPYAVCFVAIGGGFLPPP